MDLNQLYFDHQLLLMQAQSEPCADRRRLHRNGAALVAGRIGCMQVAMGARAAQRLGRGRGDRRPIGPGCRSAGLFRPARGRTTGATRRTGSSGLSFRRPHGERLPAESAQRQGHITNLAFLLLGRDAAIAFLNADNADARRAPARPGDSEQRWMRRASRRSSGGCASSKRERVDEFRTAVDQSRLRVRPQPRRERRISPIRFGGESTRRGAGRRTGGTRCRFEIYREDQVRLTATRLSDGDWHWRLSDAAGTPLVDAGGYRSEKDCRDAVSILRSEAAFGDRCRTRHDRGMKTTRLMVAYGLTCCWRWWRPASSGGGGGIHRRTEERFEGRSAAPAQRLRDAADAADLTEQTRGTVWPKKNSSTLEGHIDEVLPDGRFSVPRWTTNTA